jgi:hypothetical protein
VLGQDTIDDLAASGLIDNSGDSCRLAAEILGTDRDLRKHLAAPPLSIVTEPTAEHAEAADILFRVENRLRELVGRALSQVEETWWPSRFPAALVNEVGQRRQGEANSHAPASVEMHPLAYLTLGELFDSISEETNWEQVFKIRLGMRREAFAQATAAITAVRNKVAHNRPVDGDDITALQMATERLNLWPD